MCNDKLDEELKKIIKEKNIKFIPLTDDYMFKNVLLSDLEILKYFVISQIDRGLEPDDFYIETSENYKEEPAPKKTIEVILKKDDNISIHIYMKTNNDKYNNLNQKEFYIIQIKT